MCILQIALYIYESKLKKTKSKKKEDEFININVNRVVLEYECINIQTSCRSENILKPSVL